MRKRFVLGFVIVALAVAAFLMRRFPVLGRVGSGYAAEQTCSCLFVSGRPLDSCRDDLDPLARKLVSMRVGSDDVRASVAGIFHARAVYDAKYGCSLVE
jgi:hypothetical protein